MLSNAGELLLLMGLTLLVFLVERDFVLAGTFADFLRSSNVAFLETELMGGAGLGLSGVVVGGGNGGGEGSGGVYGDARVV